MPFCLNLIFTATEKRFVWFDWQIGATIGAIRWSLFYIELIKSLIYVSITVFSGEWRNYLEDCGHISKKDCTFADRIINQEMNTV